MILNKVTLRYSTMSTHAACPSHNVDPVLCPQNIQLVVIKAQCQTYTPPYRHAVCTVWCELWGHNHTQCMCLPLCTYDYPYEHVLERARSELYQATVLAHEPFRSRLTVVKGVQADPHSTLVRSPHCRGPLYTPLSSFIAPAHRRLRSGRAVHSDKRWRRCRT